MLQAVYSLRHYLEKRGFYVSSRLADRLGIRAKSVRLFFHLCVLCNLGGWICNLFNLSFSFKIEGPCKHEAYLSLRFIMPTLRRR